LAPRSFELGAAIYISISALAGAVGQALLIVLGIIGRHPLFAGHAGSEGEDTEQSRDAAYKTKHGRGLNSLNVNTSG